MKSIKFSKTNIVDKDIKLVGKIIKSGWLTHGKFTADFENQFKKYTKSKYAVSVSSCTAGLHLSCLASGFKKGDEIIVPAQTHTATAHAVEYTGARAIFADVDILTGNISLESIKKNITKKTKGVIIVHMAGYPCEVDKILNFCKKKKIPVICFPRGINKNYLEFANTVKPDCLSLDYEIDPTWAINNLNNYCLQGGLDPKALFKNLY